LTNFWEIHLSAGLYLYLYEYIVPERLYTRYCYEATALF
jgi:hypothetical protein